MFEDPRSAHATASPELDAYTQVAATMLNGRIGGGVIEWHSFQSMVWAHLRRALLFSINALAHSPCAANHPKIVTIRALYRDPMPLIL